MDWAMGQTALQVAHCIHSRGFSPDGSRIRLSLEAESERMRMLTRVIATLERKLRGPALADR
jgi:hypothetical protein